MQIEKRVITKSSVHLAVLLLLGVCFQADDSVRFHSLAQRVAENEKRNRLLEMSYVYEVTREKIYLGRNGEPLESESQTFEVIPLEEGDYRRILKKNGKPLPEKDAQREQQKLDESIQKRSRLSKAERERLEGKTRERRRRKNRCVRD
jgi:hypothetical protein